MTSKEELVDQIRTQKDKRRAIILAHNYQAGEVQDVADFVGDSLDLSRKAAATDAEVIVFCGVHFMAETAYILSPAKTVLLPVLEAGCPMANMVTAEKLAELKEKHPNALVVCYVNSTADVKAISDFCCTSANAADIVAQIDESAEIIFVPDQYLGSYVQQKTGRQMILWPGFCPTHLKILPEHITEKREEHPGSVVMVHPECRPDVAALADAVLSTNGMCTYAKETEASTVVVGTELGIIHRLQKENPSKKFVPVTDVAVCPNMKLTNLEHVMWALESMQHRIEVPEETRKKAETAVQRMLAVARNDSAARSKAGR